MSNLGISHVSCHYLFNIQHCPIYATSIIRPTKGFVLVSNWKVKGSAMVQPSTIQKFI